MAEAADTIEIDVTKLDEFFLHIHADPGKFDNDRKYEELWCNNKGRKSTKIPTVIGMKAKHFKVTKTPFRKEKLSLWERSAMEEDYFHIAKTNIRPEPYDLLRKLFDKNDYEATTRLLIDAIMTRITKHNMLQFSPETPYKLHKEAQQIDTIKKPDYITKVTNDPIGVVEVKRGKAFIRRSITQCMEQLNAIQQEIKNKGRDIIPLFGIVTDALHFIFIKLHPNGQFEFEEEGHEEDDIHEVKVHRAYTWDNFHEITEVINGLCQLHKKFVSTDSLM